jgi:hypothetical protein
MSNVIEASETLLAAPEDGASEHAPRVGTRPSKVKRHHPGLHAPLHAMMTWYRRHHPRRDLQFGSYHQLPERPMDLLARKYPDIFAQAMFG